MKKIRVRFAPSPTGPLHIGGVRTALYNYLFAKKHGGDFILRIEDTDQKRYIKGAEQYIIDTLSWFNISPDEGPSIGGDYGPYRQSERKEIYAKYAEQLVKENRAYYAFDTTEELADMRETYAAKGVHSVKYNYATRMEMNNSLSVSEEAFASIKNADTPMTIRLKIPKDEIIKFEDKVRGEVQFSSNELDDKIILKADGMPTYHLANIIDDHLMEISHVIRGEEWLSSTAHHVLMYNYFGWDTPEFAHLPLLLKPKGKGKLSKRDGAKFGMPVFPLEWVGTDEEDNFPGFREEGFLPEAVLNFLSLLGWNPGNNEEILSLEKLIKLFSLDKIVKSGARFDFDKAKWFNQHYIIHSDNNDLANLLMPLMIKEGIQTNFEFLASFCGLMKERVETLFDFIKEGSYFFVPPDTFEEKMIRKRFKLENKIGFLYMSDLIYKLDTFSSENIESTIKDYVTENEMKFGEVFPILRIAISGTMKGPDLFAMMSLIGREEVNKRLLNALEKFAELKQD